MEELISLPNWLAFVFVLGSVAIGWGIGYNRGFVGAVHFAMREAVDQFPLCAISWIEEKGMFIFDDMATGDFIRTAPDMETFMEFAKVEYEGKKIILVRGDQDESV